MRDSVNHEEIYFEFVKNHDQLKHVFYSDSPVKPQQVVGVLSDDEDVLNQFFEEQLSAGGVTILNPDYDAFYTDFINIDSDQETIAYITDKIENLDRAGLVDYAIENIKKILSLNILANKVYVRIYDDWSTDWLDEIIEV